jgi:hypothetical protein
MNRTKFLLLFLAALLLVAAFFFGTTDRFAGRNNCGAALFPKDTEQLVQQSGDPIEDDFEAEILRDQCGQEILRQRLLTGLFVVLAVVAIVVAFRLRPPPERFPGDPIV